MRISSNDLRMAVSRLEGATGKEFHVQHAYGGVKLCSKDESIEFSGRCTKRELYWEIHTALNIIGYMQEPYVPGIYLAAQRH